MFLFIVVILGKNGVWYGSQVEKNKNKFVFLGRATAAFLPKT
jgi:hypothetical protein